MTASRIASAIRFGPARAGDGGVHEDAGAAELHRHGGVGGGADARVDDDRHLGVLEDDAGGCRGSGIPSPEPIGADQRHHRRAADLLQPGLARMGSSMQYGQADEPFLDQDATPPPAAPRPSRKGSSVLPVSWTNRSWWSQVEEVGCAAGRPLVGADWLGARDPDATASGSFSSTPRCRSSSTRAWHGLATPPWRWSSAAQGAL